MRAQLNAGKLDADGDDSDEEKSPMLERLLKYQYPSSGNVEGKMMPDNDIISETMGHMFVLFSAGYLHFTDNSRILGLQGLTRRLLHCPICSGSLLAVRIS